MKNFNEIEKDAVDFFKTPHIHSQAAKPVKYWAMTLYTFHHTFKYLSKFVFFVALAIVLVGGATGITQSILNHRDEKALITQNQAQAERQNRINMIKKMDEKHINDIVQYVEKSRVYEENKIAKLYWTARYINIENDNKFDMKDISQAARKAMMDAENFYNNRKQEIMLAYNDIQSGHPELMYNTFDNNDPVDKILIWDSILKGQSTSTNYADDLNNNLNNVWGLLKDPAKLQAYLEDKKNFINNAEIY